MSGPGLFSYDAPRTLVRFALDPARAGRAVAARAWSVFSNTAPKNIVVEHQLSGATIGGFVHAPVTLAGAAAAARAVGDPSATAALLGEAQPAQVPPRRGPRSRGRLRRGEGPRPWGGRLRACLHAYARKPASNALGSAAIAC